MSFHIKLYFQSTKMYVKRRAHLGMLGKMIWKHFYEQKHIILEMTEFGVKINK